MKDYESIVPLFKKGQDIKGTDKLWQLWQSLPDGVILVHSKPPESKTTLQMLAYYFAVPVELCRDRINEAKDKQYTKEQIHYLLKEMFGTKEETVKLIRNKQTGKIEETVNIRLKSVANYSVQEFKEYWQEIWQFADEVLGIHIPEPDKEWWKVEEKKP